MTKNKIFLYALTAGLLLAGTGCKKYLDVNQDLNRPVAVPTGTLLTTAEANLGSALTFNTDLSSGNNGLSGVLAVYMHQMSTRETSNQYGAKGSTVDAAWDLIFQQVLPDLNVIITQGTQEDNLIYVGIAKILKALYF
jgi:hypothetical protein